MLKVAFIINKMGVGGAERVVQILSNHITKNGGMVVIYVLDDEELVYPLSEGVELIGLRGNSFFSRIKLFNLIMASFFLTKRLKNQQPDIAISFLVRANIVHVISKLFNNRSNVVVSERSVPSKIYPSRRIFDVLMNYLIKKFYQRAEKIIAISEAVKRDLVINYGLSIDKVQVIYNPIEESQKIDEGKVFAFSSNFSEGGPFIVTSSRIVPLKDHKTLLDSFRLIREKIACKLVIIGDGEEKKNLLNYANEIGLNDHIIWTGWVVNPMEIYAKCDIFVLTSIVEGFGNVIVEAMQCGLPIVSTDCGGPREILDNGRFGKLIPVGDVAALSKQVISMLLNEDIMSYYAKKSRERTEFFAVDHISKEYLNINSIK